VHSKVATLTHARVDAAVCQAPGLFRSLAPGERQGKLDVSYQYNEHVHVRFIGQQPLGVTDMRVLQALVASAAVCGHDVYLPAQPESESGKALRSGLSSELATREPGLEAAEFDTENAAVAETTYSQLATEIGYKNTRDRKLINESIRRLFGVTIFITFGGKTTGSRLLSSYQEIATSDEVSVAINPRMAAAIFGAKGSHPLRINLSESRALKTDAARLLHQRLSWINEEARRRIGMQSLCEYVWPKNESEDELERRKGVQARKDIARRANLIKATADADVAIAAKARAALRASDAAFEARILDPKLADRMLAARKSDTRRNQCSIIEKALLELMAIGWRVEVDGHNFWITRPKVARTIEMVYEELTA